MTKLMLKLFIALIITAISALPVFAAEKEDVNTYNQDSVLKDAVEFFGENTKGLAMVMEKAFRDYGRPNAYIRGEEASGAFVVGLRYGEGSLVTKGGEIRKIYWSGPSIGFDYGGNASKVFVLIYNLDDSESLFQRYPAVEGSFYFVGGAGINYQQREKVVLAPIRLGVGLRGGVSIGYINYTKTKTYNPI